MAIPRTLFRVGLATTDYLVKKSGILGNNEAKAEFIENMAGSDVYYLYNKYIEKITPDEFFKLYFNNTISHLSDRNIKQLTLAKRISPTESKEYLAEMYSLVSKLMTESSVVESAGTSKCFRHPEGFIFIIEDTPDNVSVYIQSEDLQGYLASNDVTEKMIPGRVTRRFSLTTYDDLNGVLTQMQSDLGSDYNANVRFQSATEDKATGATTYMFSVDGREADMLYSDLTSYPAWKGYSDYDDYNYGGYKRENPIKRAARAAVKGTASLVKSGVRNATGELTAPVENVAAHYQRYYSDTRSYAENDHNDDGSGNKRGNYDNFTYTYRTLQDTSILKLNNGMQFSRQGYLQRPNLDDINQNLFQIQDNPEQIAQFMAQKGFQQEEVEATQVEKSGDEELNPDIRVESRHYASWRADMNPFQAQKPQGKYGTNSNRQELWNNIVNILDGASQNEIEWVKAKLDGENTKDFWKKYKPDNSEKSLKDLLKSSRDFSDYSDIKLF
uniref:Uncharacterized protein n=1 Tax=Siphoviridae sp. ctDOT22 TaxID=2827812 RepID=A0A8S5SVK1_9CAUD|nr:MAG TPA: hypothetical protein [Siphoviridae sp. ctDOT22]